MSEHPTNHHRRSIRLEAYDYRQAGAYFITICTKDRECLFGEIVKSVMRLSEFGQIVQAEWLRNGAMRPYVALDAFVIMPNHLHGIIVLTVGATRRVAPTMRRVGPASGSIGAIIGPFKSVSAKRINRIRVGATRRVAPTNRRVAPTTPVWQRNYYEHIIRDEPSLNRIREYILTNAQRWEMDAENPHRTIMDPFDLWLKMQAKTPIPRQPQSKGDTP